MDEEATQPGTFSSFALHAPFAPFAPAPCASTPFIHVIPPSFEASATDIDDLEATQLIVDPRRLGMGGSGLNDEDLADICCILHPASLPAYRAAAHIHEDTPQYTISTESDNVQIRERHNGNFEDCETFDLAAAGLKPCDIALRLSANLKDPLGGFHFGRNKQRCDFLIGRDEKSRRVSNIHFRIYINEYGIIMLEDQSTNGTAVDGTLLRGKEKENGHDYRHTLEQGSVIMVIMMPPEVDYRFYVRIPHRDEEAELAYQRNLTAYFLRLLPMPVLNLREIQYVGRMNILELLLTQCSPTSSPQLVLELRILRRCPPVDTFENGEVEQNTTRLATLARGLLLLFISSLLSLMAFHMLRKSWRRDGS
jgi:hypothetical protein